MNWRHETWRKLYVREEGSFAALSYSARAAAAMLLKLCDEQGRIYARPGDDIIEVICFRFGADRGERRMVRKGIEELVADKHLEQGEGWVRIRNFRRAQGREDEVPPDVASTVSRMGLEPVANETRPCIDGVANETRPCLEPVANETRPRSEDCVNDTESFTSPSVVPSVPFLPSVPSESEAPIARARDPRGTATATKPKWRSGYEWWFAFTLSWSVAKKGLTYTAGGSTRAQGELEDILARMPDAELEALWERRTEFFARYLESKDPRIANGNHPFPLFVSRFSDFRPDLPGPSARASPARDVSKGWAKPSGDYGEAGAQKL